MGEQTAEKGDYERALGEHFDMSRIDPVFGGRDCPATHPVTGRPCVYPEGHEDHHWAMGSRRMQMFGPDLACAESTTPPSRRTPVNTDPGADQ